MKNKGLSAAVLLAVFAVGVGAGAVAYHYGESHSPQNRKLEEIKGIIDDSYLFGEAPETREDWIYSGLLGSIGDKYADYYTKSEFEDFQAENNGNYVGIGTQVNENTVTGVKTVVNCYEGGPAALAGVKAGDLIKAVDGVSAEDKDLKSLVADDIKGEEGTAVELTVYRPDTDETLVFTVERKDVVMKTVGSRMLRDDTGYIRVSEFLENTANDFVSAVDAMQESGAETLLIDLRDNPGGSLTAVSRMADYIIEDDISENSRCFGKSSLAYTLDKSGDSVSMIADDGHRVDLPIVILMNGYSASASELFAGALRDSGKALLLGTDSYGKGIVQSTIPLNDGGAVKLTVSQYYTPDGFALHGLGLTPDVELERDEPLEQEDTFMNSDALSRLTADNQTEKALEVLAGLKEGKRTLSVSAGENNQIEAPAEFTELAERKACQSPHLELTEEQAEEILPKLVNAQGLRLFSCEDDWNSEGGVTRGTAECEHERYIQLLDPEDGSISQGVRFGFDAADGRAHWFSLEKIKPQAAADMVFELLKNDVGEAETIKEKLGAVNTEGGSYQYNGKGFRLVAKGINGRLNVEVYAEK